MRNSLIVFIVIISTFTVHAQRFNGYVVTNSNDTIKCKFSLEMNMFDKTLFYDSGISKGAKIYKENGEKAKYKPTELKTVFITGPKQGDYKFVSLEQDKEHFFHEKIKGKLSYYVVYKGNLQGGFPIEIPYFLKDGNLIEIKGFSSRKKFGELIDDYPGLYEKWIDSNNYYKISQIEEVIKLYNEYFTK
ncbi:MAG: hypothetical protein QMA99_05595 [Flavobacterium sp.]|jgi:hypothetical protein